MVLLYRSYLCFVMRLHRVLPRLSVILVSCLEGIGLLLQLRSLFSVDFVCFSSLPDKLLSSSCFCLSSSTIFARYSFSFCSISRTTRSSASSPSFMLSVSAILANSAVLAAATVFSRSWFLDLQPRARLSFLTAIFLANSPYSWHRVTSFCISCRYKRGTVGS
jgi:hypothetical protein